MEYYKIVPCNPLLSFFGLLRLDKNRDKFKPTTEVLFVSRKAKTFYEKYCKNGDVALLELKAKAYLKTED